jgi:NADP-dependent 3-hydroxy acid dehydrogenase YdfG
VTIPFDATRALHARTALVTGATHGIGKAVALELARAGAKVVAVARDPDALVELQATAHGPGSIYVEATDIRSSHSVRHAVATCLRTLGEIDLLVNCAGVYSENAVEEISDGEWDAVLDTNLRGVFNVCREVVPAMKERRRGHIISVASVAALRGFPRTAAYTASKYGVLGFMEALDEEVREFGIRVTTLCPGPTSTRMTADWEVDETARASFLQPLDVARATVWVASQPRHVSVDLLVIRPLVASKHSGYIQMDG